MLLACATVMLSQEKFKNLIAKISLRK